jgi:hypothetical protein
MKRWSTAGYMVSALSTLESSLTNNRLLVKFISFTNAMFMS